MSDVEDRSRQTKAEYDADPIEVNRQIVEEYRATGGHIERLGGTSRMLLLTTVGARSGRTRTAPMMFVRDGDRVVVYASNIGSRRHPAWYRNLVARPEVTVELGGERFEAVARVTEGDERDRLWRLFPFPEHQEKTSRQIPVVSLERRPAREGTS
ncbi:MAG: nitroreductase family deazaflavin-dependent oxidoreductase [Candidatus Dormibacteraeota bacterium]|nr:nitroreductase family deazaflavin-dependent oxidoreductase [Candidatus Dormibacteraeota bacterium]